MPYKRYDITNRYTISGRRKNENIVLKTVLLIVIPVLIAAVIALGIFIAFKTVTGGRGENTPVTSPDEVAVISDEDLLRVVNERHPLESDYVPELKPFGSVRISGYMFEDLDDMISAAAAEDIKLTLAEGYVSYADQAVLYDETYKKIKEEQKCSDIKAESETKKVCPLEGASESQTGLLVKFETDSEDFANSEADTWLQRNAVNYGFVLRYPEGREDSTGMKASLQLYRYVGKEHALNMRRYDMTLDEYSSHIDR